MENFNHEKEKYDILSKDEQKLNDQFNELKQKYTDFKTQIDNRKDKEEKYVKESRALENRIKTLNKDSSALEEKKHLTKRKIEQS